jgi:hypothetical protein
MLGLPLAAWIIGGVVVILVVRVRMLYSRFRRMCRGVREELTHRVRTEVSGVAAVHERLGNLVVRLEDGSERVWELSDVYTAMARLPGMGADPQARETVFQRALTQFRTVRLADGRVRPQLVPLATAQADANGTLYMEVSGLPLAAIYVRADPAGPVVLTRGNAPEAAEDLAGLHRQALEALRADFPHDALMSALDGDSGSALQLADGYDAARLLLLPSSLPEDAALIALVPHRDRLLLLPDAMREDPEKLREGMGMLREDHGHPPLLDRPVRVTSEGFALL